MKYLLIPFILLTLACALTPVEEETEPTAQNPSATTANPTNTVGSGNTNGSGQKIQFYLIIVEDNGASGTPVGCNDSLIGVDAGQTTTGTLERDIKTALDALFSLKTESYGQSGFITALADMNLAVENVTLTNDSAIINMGGGFLLTGVCADARIEAQILATVFQFPQINEAFIYINNESMKQLFDMSGQVLEDTPYTREDLP